MLSHAPPLSPSPSGGAKLLVLDGFVLDVELFAAQHPGGANLVKVELGNDITVSRRGRGGGAPRHAQYTCASSFLVAGKV